MTLGYQINQLARDEIDDTLLGLRLKINFQWVKNWGGAIKWFSLSDSCDHDFLFKLFDFFLVIFVLAWLVVFLNILFILLWGLKKKRKCVTTCTRYLSELQLFFSQQYMKNISIICKNNIKAKCSTQINPKPMINERKKWFKSSTSKSCYWLSVCKWNMSTYDKLSEKKPETRTCFLGILAVCGCIVGFVLL